MGIENGQQVLPTEGFDFADDTDDEIKAYEDQINDEQEINDKNTATLEVDDVDDAGDVDSEGDSEVNEEDQPSDDSDSVAETGSDGDKSENADSDTADSDDTERKGEEAAESKREETEVSKKEKFERYSRSVQRRINKGTKQREALRSENEALRSRLDKIENKITTDGQESEANVLANRIRNATTIKQQLLEEGEYEQLAQVDDDIIKMRIHQAKLDERSQQQQYEGNAQLDQPAQPVQPQQSQVEVPSLQTEWINGNTRFGQDKSYTDYVNSTYDTLVDEGYDPENASMYEELNKRTGTAPLKVAAQRATAKPKPAARVRPQSAPTPNVNQSQKSSRPKGLTEADKINMRNWGLDPSNVDARKEWISNKK